MSEAKDILSDMRKKNGIIFRMRTAQADYDTAMQMYKEMKGTLARMEALALIQKFEMHILASNTIDNPLGETK